MLFLGPKNPKKRNPISRHHPSADQYLPRLPSCVCGRGCALFEPSRGPSRHQRAPPTGLFYYYNTKATCRAAVALIVNLAPTYRRLMTFLRETVANPADTHAVDIAARETNLLFCSSLCTFGNVKGIKSKANVQPECYFMFIGKVQFLQV